MPEYTEEELGLLREVVSDPVGDVFIVLPNPKIAGKIGAALARYSRARGGFRETLLKDFVRLGAVDSALVDAFIERVLIAYGDDSVQEFEGAWLSLERVSNLATKAVEDGRLGSYIEQSTRYVFYDQRDSAGDFLYYRGPEILKSAVGARYTEAMNQVFELYVRLIEPMQDYFKRRKPRETARYKMRENATGERVEIGWTDCRDDEERKQFDITWRMDIRTKTCDTLRILLPVATLTNVGMFANGRTYQSLLTRIYSSDVPELHQLGSRAHDALNCVIPRYVQRAKRDPYLVDTRRAMQALVRDLLDSPDGRSAAEFQLPSDRVKRLPSYFVTSPFYPIQLLAAMIYPFVNLPMADCRRLIANLPEEAWEKLYQTYCGERKTRRDRVGRAFEFNYPWLFDLTINVGIYRDLQRHRMMTQQRQPFMTSLGFDEIPPEIAEAGFADEVLRCAEMVNAFYVKMRSELGDEMAQYPVLFGFLTRFAIGFNEREAEHLLELRTSAQGHRSYRLVCQEIARQMLEATPWLADVVLRFVDWGDYDWPRAESEASQRIKEARLS